MISLKSPTISAPEPEVGDPMESGTSLRGEALAVPET